MTYAIGNVIYGTPLTEEIIAEIEAVIQNLGDNNYDIGDPESYGFKKKYTGNGEFPTGCYFGIDIDSIDECSNVNLVDLFAKIKEVQNLEEKYDKKLQGLEDWVRRIVMKHPARPWIVWSSS